MGRPKLKCWIEFPNMVADAGYVLISTNQVTSSIDRVVVQCPQVDHPAYEVTSHNFRAGKRCYICSFQAAGARRRLPPGEKRAREAAHRNSPEYKEKKAARYQTNKNEIALKNKIWRDANREKMRLHYRTRWHTDPNFKLGKILRARVRAALKSQDAKKHHSALEFLGCTILELRMHLESQFRPGMTWENHGQWHIDHIRPLSSFNLQDPEQQKLACHYTNLQPLWAKENLSKGDKIP